MREISQRLRAKLDAGATTLCQCWRIDRRDGETLGFTDHDQNLLLDEVMFEASSGFSGSAVERSLGLSVDNMTATGALRSDRISAADIAGGKYDGAEFRLWTVDWQAPDDRILSFAGQIGEITRSQSGYEVEILGLSEKLNQPVGRRYLPVCDARLGDGRCTADLGSPHVSGEGRVVSISGPQTIVVSGLSEFEAYWFSGGRLRWTDGAADGDPVPVRSHLILDGKVVIQLALPWRTAPEPGDRFVAVAGCDKRFATCCNKFSNGRNFQGFPFIPGESWLTAYPRTDDVHDGGARNDR